MQKPLTVIRQEFAEHLVELINDSELPAFVISETLKKTITAVDNLADAQYEKDKQAWEESQKEKTE